MAVNANTFSEVQNNGAINWHRHGQTISINVPENVAVTKLKFMVNGNDFTDLFVRNSATSYSLVQTLTKLPSGENTLEIFDVTTNDWALVKSQTLKVLSKSGFRKANVSMLGSIGLSRQIEGNLETNNVDEFGLDVKQNQNQLDLQLSLSSEHSTNTIMVTSQVNIVGSSNRENSLQFSDREQKANKVDLSDYLVNIQGEKLQLSVGHKALSSNPLLLDNLANRGLQITYQLNDYINIAMSQQNGSAIVGWQNLLGQQSSEHRISSAVLKSELFPEEEGKMRVELTYINGRTLAINDFAVGEVADVEKNQGIGIKIEGRGWEDVLNYQISYASSRFSNPKDEAFEFNDLSPDQAIEFNLVPLDTEKSSAFVAQVGIALLPQIDVEDQFFNAYLSLEYTRLDALYRSIGAATEADLTKSILKLAGDLGEGTWQYRYLQKQNNVDDIPTILTSRTVDHSFNYDIDLSTVFGNTGHEDNESELSEDSHTAMFNPSWLTPHLNLQVQRTHQYALNNPIDEFSDFNSPSHLPDQVSELVDFSAQWNINNYSIAYAMSYSHQDNRQQGRERADFSIVNHSARQHWVLNEILSFGLELSRARNVDRELGQVFYQNNGLVNINWQATNKLTVNVNASKNRDYDNLATSLNKAYTLGADLQYQWQFNVHNQAFSGQWSVRYAKQQNAVNDNQFNFNTFTQNWHVYSGIRISF